MAKIKDKTEGKQDSAPGIFVMAGEIETSDFDKLDWHTQLQDYVNMRNGDGVISTSIDALKMPILRSEYEIIAGNDSEKAIEAKEYIEWSLDNIKGGFTRFARHCLLSLDYGLSMFEKVYKKGVKYHNGISNKTTNVISKFATIGNDTINAFHYDDISDFTGIEHEKRVPEGSTVPVDIKADKLFWLSYNEERDDIRGRSLLRPIREAWSYKKKIMTATTRACQRGAGVPIATVSGDLSETNKAQAKTLCRTIGNSESAYGIEQKDKITFRFEQLQNQENNMPMIELLNREIFFNSLTQFMTSGLGQSGSRASASELKTTYELAAASIQKWLEYYMQKIVDEMIDISYLANIKKEDRPTFSFASISQVDLDKASMQLKNLLDSGAIVKQPDDENSFRNMFGIEETVDIAQNTEVEESQEESVTEVQEGALENRVSLDRQKNLDRAKEIFEFESASNHFLETQKAVETLTDEMVDKIFKDISTQLEGNRKKDIHIKKQYTTELIDKLQDLYEGGAERGFNDYIKELTKVVNKEVKLNRVNLIDGKANIKRGLEKTVKTLGVIIKARVEERMDMLTDQYIINAGGVDKVIETVKTKGLKGAKRNIITATESGYTAGRGNAMLANEDLVEDHIYVAVLDEGLCDNCAPFDGEIFTFEEIINSGFATGQPINPDCLGGMKCRCQWVANNAKDRAGFLTPSAPSQPIHNKPIIKDNINKDAPLGYKLPKGVLSRKKGDKK